MLQHLLKQYDKLSERISSLEAEVSNLKSRADSRPKSVVKEKRAKSSDKKKSEH
jgi:cell division protein FtsB